MDARNQKTLLWLGAVMAAIFSFGYAGMIGFFPPPAPDLSAAAVAELYAQSNIQLRLGVMLCLLSGGFYLPWVLVISLQMRRYEQGMPIWTAMQGLAGTLQTGLFFAAPLLWAAAGFSAQRDPAITLLMHELAFLTFVTPLCVFPLQLIPIAMICLGAGGDDAQSPFPRWLGYITLFLAVSSEAGLAAVVFKSGPFAWNGLLAFYVPFVTESIRSAHARYLYRHPICTAEKCLIVGVERECDKFPTRRRELQGQCPPCNIVLLHIAEDRRGGA